MEVIFRNVCFSYNKNDKDVIKDVSFVLDSNKVHGIIGPIGSGKSTLIELMNGLVKPTSGDVVIGNYELFNKKFNFNKFRNDVGLVYQFPEKQFFCSTVAEEISFSSKIFDKKNKYLKSKIIKALKMVGLDSSYLKRNPFDLNSGEKRRVAIASVLISNPKLLIMDEPTIGLDIYGKKKLIKLINGLKNKYLKTIIIVTHDIDLLYEIVDNVIVLDNGSIVINGDKREVFSKTDVLKDLVPSIVKMEKIIHDKAGIDLGYIKNINELVEKIKTYKNGVISDE